MDNLILDNFEFRVKKMSSIEILSLRSQISFNGFEKAKNTYSTILENMEVKIDEKWIPVKEKDKEIYYPAKLEDDVKMLDSLLEYSLQYFKSVFQESKR